MPSYYEYFTYVTPLPVTLLLYSYADAYRVTAWRLLSIESTNRAREATALKRTVQRIKA
ncbi:hypothetical protein X777_12498 [Ooceraea biroi]|uniref:Uncharacterized protein n=1 Tax=Ooceraea biroi TaxID=2015173 RepID=A0A026W242_OOCBI|nr:hypothetical protein X777_12498 [Ooceraea biroi]